MSIVNAFDDFSQTACADDNTPNVTGNLLKNFIGIRKILKNSSKLLLFTETPKHLDMISSLQNSLLGL